MSTKQTKEEDQEATQGPRSFAELCESMMTAGKGEPCGGRMQEMMSRCMAGFPDEEKEPK